MQKLLVLISFILMALLSGCKSGSNSEEELEVLGLGSEATYGSGGSGGSNANYDEIVFGGIVSAQTVSDTKVKITFLPASGGSRVFSYTVYVGEDYESPFTHLGVGAFVNNNGTLEAILTDLTPSTSYTFSVRAYDAAQNKEDKNTETATTTTNASNGTFAGINNITSVTSASMTLNWTNFSGNTGYKIFDMSSGNPVYVATTAPDATSYIVTGLTPNTQCTWRVRVLDSVGGEDANTNDESETTADVLDFAGVDDPVSQLSSTSLRLTWTHIPGATFYKIYDVTSGEVQIGSVAAPATYYDVTGLVAGSTYSFMVRAQDVNGYEDDNLVTVTQAMPTTVATFNGWTNAKATGPRIDFTGAETEPGEVILRWRESTSSGAAITGYNIYRSTISGGSFTKINDSVIGTGVVGEDIVYQEDESELTPGTAYFYKVSVIIGGAEYFHEVTSPVDHTELRIIYPNNNEGFVHRWIANQDMCGEIGRGLGLTVAAQAATDVDVENNYRCQYNGFASTDDGGTFYYDLGHDLVVDLHETGCPFSQGVCSSHNDGTTVTTDCVDDALPTAAIEAPQFSVFYSRAHNNHLCYLQTSADASNPVWTHLRSFSSSGEVKHSTPTAYGQYFYGNQVNLPPLVHTPQAHAWEVCQTQTPSLEIEGATLNYRKRLLRNKEWTAAAQWDPSYTATAIYNIESTTCALGSSAVTNLTYDTSNWPSVHGHSSILATGTADRSSCRSRYGMANMAGGATEYVSDQCYGEGNVRACSFNTTPTLDINSTNDWINGSDGAYFRMGSSGYDPGYHGMWSYNGSVRMNTTNWFNPIIGLPMACDSGYCDGQSDDNTLVSSQAAGGVNVNNYYSPYQTRGYITGGNTTLAQFFAFMRGGITTVTNINYSTYVSLNSDNGGVKTSARCMYPVAH